MSMPNPALARARYDQRVAACNVRNASGNRLRKSYQIKRDDLLKIIDRFTSTSIPTAGDACLVLGDASGNSISVRAVGFEELPPALPANT
jgi:hypothetical protein